MDKNNFFPKNKLEITLWCICFINIIYLANSLAQYYFFPLEPWVLFIPNILLILVIIVASFKLWRFILIVLGLFLYSELIYPGITGLINNSAVIIKERFHFDLFTFFCWNSTFLNFVSAILSVLGLYFWGNEKFDWSFKPKNRSGD